MKTEVKPNLIQHALRVMHSPEFRRSDSPLWSARQHRFPSPMTPEVIANQIIDLQLHGIDFEPTRY